MIWWTLARDNNSDNIIKIDITGTAIIIIHVLFQFIFKELKLLDDILNIYKDISKCYSVYKSRGIIKCKMHHQESSQEGKIISKLEERLHQIYNYWLDFDSFINIILP